MIKYSSGDTCVSGESDKAAEKGREPFLMVVRNDSVSCIVLAGTQYLIHFTYNDTAGYWTFGLYTPLNVPIVIGIKIIPSFSLNLFYGVTSLPFGVFGAMTNLDHIGRDDFRNGKAKFIFAPVYK